MPKAMQIIVNHMSDFMGMGELTPLVRRRLCILNPLVDFVLEGKRPLIRAAEVDGQAVAAGVNAVLKIPGDLIRVRAIPMSEIVGLPRDADSYAVLALHVSCVEFGTILERLGENRAERLLTVVKIALSPGYKRLLTTALKPAKQHFDEKLVYSVLTPYVALTAAFVGHLATGDDESAIRLAPHLRHLAQVVPVGATAAEPFTWIVLCA